MHFCSKGAATPLSNVVKCSSTLKTLMWFPNAYIDYYDLATSVGGMDMCNVSLLNSSHPL